MLVDKANNTQIGERTIQPCCAQGLGKGIIQRLGACLKDVPTQLFDYTKLFCKLHPRYAKDIEVVACDSKTEEHRAIWATYNHMNNTEVAAEHEGKLLFFDGQLQPILNLDETGILLNSTTKVAGGQPTTEYSSSNKKILVGIDKRNKIGYFCTFIGGSTGVVSGYPFPLQLQLKGAVKDDGSRFKCAWGSGKVVLRGLTVNCNALAGMDFEAFKQEKTVAQDGKTTRCCRSYKRAAFTLL
eukprot:jgi/Psemu1/11386/gm1.11386_g